MNLYLLNLDLLNIIKDYIIFKPSNNEELNNAVIEWFINKNFALICYGHITNWDTSKITNMSNLFNGEYIFYYTDFISFNDNINYWNVSNVTDMSYMFYEESVFNQPLNNWNVLNVTDMSCMFDGAKSFNQQLYIWDTSKYFDNNRISWRNINVLKFIKPKLYNELYNDLKRSFG